MGKSTISMAIFNSKLLVYQRANASPSYISIYHMDHYELNIYIYHD